MAALTRGRPWLDALAVVVAALILFAFTMPHTVTFEDAGLFDSVCYTGGIAHPPGYPLFTLMCTPLFQLPLEPAIIGNSMSALFGALTCGLLVLVLDRLGVIRLVSITGGLLLAVSDTFWSQSIIVEVYTLNTLLVLGVLYFSLCFREAPSRYLAWTTTLVFSLSIANHWPLTVLALPGLLAVCLSRLDWILEQRRNPVFWAGLVGSALLGISPYFTLLLKHHLIVSFSGPVDGPKALWDYFMRRAYTHVDSQAAANITDKWHYILWFIRRMPHEISLVLLPFAALGVLAGHKRLGWPVQVGIGLIFLGGSLGLILLLGYEYEYPHEISLRPFLLVGWLGFVIFTAIGLDVAAGYLRRFRRPGIIALGLLCATGIALTFVQNLPRNDRTHDTLAADYAKLVLGTVDRNAAILSASDADTFPVAYEHFVKGKRPDVTLLQIKNTIFPDKLPGNTLEDRITAATAIARHRPLYVFFDVPGFPQGENLGLFKRYQPGSHRVASANEPIARFRHRLIKGWLSNRFTDMTERDFVNQALINFTGHLLALSSVQPLDAGDARDLADLEKTFSGAIATLAWTVNHPGFKISANEILDIAFRAEANIPPEASNLNKATFHYAFALLYLSGAHGIPVNKPFARLLLLKSFQDLPSPDTPGLCQLLALGPPPGHLSTTPRFEAQCAKTGAKGS